MKKRGKALVSRNKAQAAMEFFLTYGWAILVVTILVATLVYMNVFNPKEVLPEKCIIRTDSGLFCVDFNAVAGSGVGTGIIVRIKNVLETKKVTINNIAATFEKNGVDVTCTGETGVVLEPEEIRDFTLGEGCTLVSGDQIKADLIINYRIEEGLDKTVVGTFMKVVP